MSDHALTSLLHEAVEDHIQWQHVPGAVVAVTGQDGGPVVFAAGFEDLHRTQPMRAGSRFPNLEHLQDISGSRDAETCPLHVLFRHFHEQQTVRT